MHNLGTVVSFELVRTLKKKTFWLSVLAFPLLLAAIVGLSYFSNKSAEDASDKLNQDKFSFAVVDRSMLVSPALVTAAQGRVVTNDRRAIQDVKEGRLDAVIIYPSNPADEAVRIYAKDAGLTKNGKYPSVATQLLQASVTSSIGSPRKVALLTSEPDVSVTTYVGGKEVKGIERAIAPGIFLVLFYVLIVLLGNQMLTSTTEEKENRVIEMVLTTVSARSLIIGKIVTMMLLGVIQVITIVVPLIIAYVFFKDSLNIPAIDFSQIVLDPVRMLVGGSVFTLGFMLFTGMLVAIGSAMPTAKEAGGFFGFAMILMFAPLYALAAIVSSPEQLMVKVFSFFPLTAPITLMLRNAVDNLSGTEIAAGLLVLALSSVLALVLAVRIFKTGSLRYDTRMSATEIFRLRRG